MLHNTAFDCRRVLLVLVLVLVLVVVGESDRSCGGGGGDLDRCGGCRDGGVGAGVLLLSIVGGV